MTDFKCTCPDIKCPYHPTRHDKGCDLCIEINNKAREIPNCFFIAAGIDPKEIDNFTFHNFAKLMLEKTDR